LGAALRRKKELTPSSLSADQSLPDWTAAGFARGRWADWLGSAMKPLMEYGKRVGYPAFRKRLFSHEKTHFREEVGCVR
jgi:hypothetical protein